MIKIRNQKRQKVAKRRGRTSTETFQNNDPVRLQNPRWKKWDLKGVITEIRLHPNGNPSSFVIKKKNGRSIIRHKSQV